MSSDALDGRRRTSDCTGRRAAEFVRYLQVDRAAPVNRIVVPQPRQDPESRAAYGERRSRGVGGEASPLRLSDGAARGRCSWCACSQPQQPRPSATSDGVEPERAVACEARLRRAHSRSRLCERVIHVGRRQGAAPGEAKSRIRLCRGTTSDCTGRRAAELGSSILY